MKKTVFIAILMALTLPVAAQKTENSAGQMPMKRAMSLVPRPNIAPVKSMIPAETALSVDTLDTSDPGIKLVLRSDNTWEYIKNREWIDNDEVYKLSWNHDAAKCYNVKYEDLPFRATLWLADSTTRFYCPYQEKVFSKFGWRKGRQHTGVDIPYPMGTPVGAAFEGKVRFAKRCGGYGNLVIIRHPNGLETFYGHLSKINVTEDQWVSAGEIIGLGGSTGRSTGPHLHFETRYMGYAFDPQWIIDFEKAELKHGVFVLHRKYLTPGSTYVPESEDEEEAIYLSEEEERAEEERIAREMAAAKYHKIRSGDTLSGLAVKYHTTVKAICKLNGITAKTTLRPGRTLRVK